MSLRMLLFLPLFASFVHSKTLANLDKFGPITKSFVNFGKIKVNVFLDSNFAPKTVIEKLFKYNDESSEKEESVEEQSLCRPRNKKNSINSNRQSLKQKTIKYEDSQHVINDCIVNKEINKDTEKLHKRAQFKIIDKAEYLSKKLNSKLSKKNKITPSDFIEKFPRKLHSYTQNTKKKLLKPMHIPRNVDNMSNDNNINRPKYQAMPVNKAFLEKAYWKPQRASVTEESDMSYEDVQRFYDENN
ncbi:unnamed protein product [Plutella xylostella]|uniref:(diamondback moth) hypothetical protein n=1 Tax=Plutella xylostella TaxID=51655 RepID=A0A8S4D6L3_PLUXY|nr:unnamed protein product [Plutella xylostella]